jgi:TolB protein
VAPEAGARWVAHAAWSPDGRQLAYVQDWAIHVRPVSGGAARRLAVTAPVPLAEPHALAWSPDGRWIAFVDNNAEFTFGLRPWGSTINLGNSAPSAIWRVPAQGGEVVRLTDGRTLNTSPVWLPDGRGLVFVSNRDGSRDVYQLALDESGHPAAPAVRVTAGLDVHSASLARDGRRLGYSVFRSAANVWSLPVPRAGVLTDASAEPVTSGSQTVEGLSVSADGQWLAFDTDRNGNQDVYVVRTRGGGEPRALSTDPSDEFMPHWSPDGRELAYYRFGSDGRRRMLTVPAAGGASRPVVDAPRDQRSPHWSPNGRALVFSSDATGRHELYVTARARGGAWQPARRLTTGGGYAGRWSPDGRTIAFARPDGIWTVAAGGGAPRPVLRIDRAQEASLGYVEWSADGRTLFFKWIDDQGLASFRAVPAAGGPPRVLVQLHDPRRRSPRPEFATDGRRFYFTIAERESDVWTMELDARP